MERARLSCWAIVIVGIARVVLGARRVDAGKTTAEGLISVTRRQLALTAGIAVDERLSVMASGG